MNKAGIRKLNDDAIKALAATAKKHGMVLSMKKGRFDEDGCTLTYELAHTTKSGVSQRSSEDWKILVTGTKIAKTPFGAKFRMNGTTYTVIDVHLSRPVWPIVAKGPRGGKYKFKVCHVESGLI